MPILIPQEKNYKKLCMRPVKQHFDTQLISNVEKTVSNELSKPEISERIKPGMKIAIAVGSRGITAIDRIVKATARWLIAARTNPFIVSAMGSHGGGTGEGQAKILAGYGITEENIGIPIVAQMNVVELGTSSFGSTIYTDKAAYEADMTILINRVKAHTDFEGPIESGLCKMAAIGLANHRGCVAHHKMGTEAFPELIPEAASIVVASGNIGFGLAIVENALDQPYIIEAVPAETMLHREAELLQISKKVMARLNFPEIDILFIEEIGKDISGCGADPNVIGGLGPKKNSKTVPSIKCTVILGLSDKTHGNATGIGMGDLTVKKAFNAIDYETTYTNCMVGGSRFGLDCARIPMVLEDEDEATAVALKVWGGSDSADCRVVKIKNTSQLERIWVSKALWPYIEKNPQWFSFED